MLGRRSRIPGALVFVNRFFYPDHSATSQMLTDLAFALSEKGCRVYVLSSRQIYDDASARLPKEQVVNGVHVRRVWTSRFGRSRLAGRFVDYITFYLSSFAVLWSMVSAGDIIVAKTDPPLISVVGWAVAKMKKAYLVNWLQDLFPEIAFSLSPDERTRGWIVHFLSVIRNISLRCARTNVAIGQKMAGRLVSTGIGPLKIKVIHNWANGEQIYPVQPEENRLRQEWSLTGRFVVGYSGNLGRVHEVETLLHAAKLIEHDRRVTFLIIGGGAQYGPLQRKVADMGLDNFVFKPYQPRNRLHESLSAADVHLISLKAEFEGLVVPSKFYGIAAAGRPIIFVGDPSGEIGSEVLASGCGFSVPIGAGNELATCITRLADNRELQKTMGQNARRLFAERFDKSYAVQSWLKLLDEV